MVPKFICMVAIQQVKWFQYKWVQTIYTTLSLCLSYHSVSLVFFFSIGFFFFLSFSPFYSFVVSSFWWGKISHLRGEGVLTRYKVYGGEPLYRVIFWRDVPKHGVWFCAGSSLNMGPLFKT